MHSVIWDLGGTLVDTYPDVDRALASAVSGDGRPPTQAQLDEVARLTRVSSGHAIEVLAERHGRPAEALRDAYEATKELWRTSPPPVMPGAQEVMEAVRRLGGLNLVATHRDRDSASQLLHTLGLRVDDLVCAPDGFARKPDPAMMHELLRRHRLATPDVLAVGDRPGDVLAARAAGVRGLLLVTPGVPLEAVDDLEGSERIGALEELVPLLAVRDGRLS